MTQEQAANQAVKEMLNRLDGDPGMKARMERPKELQAMMENL
jgi:hypothetical protein